MIGIEKKNINNKPYNYLTEQVKFGKKFKKVQVFIGKNIPNDLGVFYLKLKNKEKDLLGEQIKNNLFKSEYLQDFELKRVESARIDWKYFTAAITQAKHERVFRDFAIEFIFESNAIEGSKLSQNEVSKIILKQYVKKTTPRHEVIEVLNAISAFEFIRSDAFTLNQKSIKKLHAIVTQDLDIEQGFKKKANVVSNKETVDPKKVKQELQRLITWYKNSKNSEHPFARAILFHNRFEHIHPFADGNGRTGRILLNWMLMRDGYGLILFKNRNRVAYRSALGHGDEGRYQKLIKLSTKTHRATISKLITG